jgi:hypothetical protein
LASKQAIIASPPATCAHRQQPRGLNQVEAAGGGEAEYAVVPLPDVVVGPVSALGRLIGPVIVALSNSALAP